MGCSSHTFLICSVTFFPIFLLKFLPISQNIALWHPLSYRKSFLFSVIRWEKFGWWSVFPGSMSLNSLHCKNATFNITLIFSWNLLHLPWNAWGKKKNQNNPLLWNNILMSTPNKIYFFLFRWIDKSTTKASILQESKGCIGAAHAHRQRLPLLCTPLRDGLRNEIIKVGKDL